MSPFGFVTKIVSYFSHVLLILMGVLFIATSAFADRAPPMSTVVTSHTNITVVIGEGRLVKFAKPASDVVIGDPTVADVRAISPRMVWVFGKAVGTTTLAAVPSDGHEVASISISVVRSPSSASAAVSGAVSLDGSRAMNVGFAGNQLVLSGHFGSLGPAIAATDAASSFAPKGNPLLNLGRLDETPEITLHVQIAEVSRTALKQLGVNWNVLATPGRFTTSLLTGTFVGQALSATSFANAGVGYSSGPVSVNTLVNALSQQGSLRMLAEPNLTTISGEQASFLAGGEIPIPVPQSFGVTTIAYKTYGVSLAFTPTLVQGDRIALHVRPEVSAVSAANSVTIGGVSVPAFTTERTETNVEMASGQTLAIAGLFQNTQQNAINGIPALGDLPILGPLFKSTQFQHDQSELVILITPYLTHPIGNPGATALPVERIDALRQALGGSSSSVSSIAAGYAIN